MRNKFFPPHFWRKKNDLSAKHNPNLRRGEEHYFSSFADLCRGSTFRFLGPAARCVRGPRRTVAAKMHLVWRLVYLLPSGLAAPLLEVWVHDAASNRWEPVDEDCALVVNEKATAYHVVVPMA